MMFMVPAEPMNSEIAARTFPRAGFIMLRSRTTNTLFIISSASIHIRSCARCEIVRRHYFYLRRPNDNSEIDSLFNDSGSICRRPIVGSAPAIQDPGVLFRSSSIDHACADRVLRLSSPSTCKNRVNSRERALSPKLPTLKSAYGACGFHEGHQRWRSQKVSARPAGTTTGCLRRDQRGCGGHVRCSQPGERVKIPI